MRVRKAGVEEELFVVDAAGRLSSLSDRVIRLARGDDALDHELFLQQVETTTDAHEHWDPLRADVLAQRRVAVEAADGAGVRLAAMPTDVLGGSDPDTTPTDRYERLLDEFREVGRQGLTCGMHVHVDVDDHDAVPVIDALRSWTPLVVAIAAGSPFVDGRDTGYASWRGFSWDTWPTAGPVEPFVDDAGYRAAVKALVATGAALDEHMLYLDARVAEDYPTVEVRVADVCADVDDAVLVAELCRALVDTALELPTRPWRIELLRAARWRARRDGVRGRLVDPVTGDLDDAPLVLERLLDHLSPSLRRHESLDLVTARVHHLLEHGTGADRQRRIADDAGLPAVVDDVVSRTRSV